MMASSHRLLNRPRRPPGWARRAASAAAVALLVAARAAAGGGPAADPLPIRGGVVWGVPRAAELEKVQQAVLVKLPRAWPAPITRPSWSARV
jgi:hypothetical protein